MVVIPPLLQSRDIIAMPLLYYLLKHHQPKPSTPRTERSNSSHVFSKLGAYRGKPILQPLLIKILDDKSEEIQSFINRLYDVNGQMWDAEGGIRSGVADALPLEEIGKLALKCRDINRLRNGIKGEIVDAFSEGFKELKVNYTKVNYGGNEID